MEKLVTRERRTLSITLRPETMMQSNDGTITGIIYFECSDEQFPESGWSDYVIIIIYWWLECIKKLAEGSSNVERLQFMDGAYYVYLTSKADALLAEWICRPYEDTPEWSGVISLEELVHTILATANVALQACKEKGWLSEEINILKYNANSLETIRNKAHRQIRGQ